MSQILKGAFGKVNFYVSYFLSDEAQNRYKG